MYRRLAIISALVIVIAIPIVAQNRQAQGQGQGQGKALQQFQQALDLTPAQETQLQGLLDTRRQQTQSLAQDTREKARALRSLMEQPNPNPTDVGNATLALRGARQKMQGIQQTFQTDFKAILRSDQVAKYDELLKAGKGRRGFGRGFGRFR